MTDRKTRTRNAPKKPKTKEARDNFEKHCTKKGYDFKLKELNANR